MIQAIKSMFTAQSRIKELEKKLQEAEDNNASLHSNTMNMALAFTDYFEILTQISKGDLTVTANERTGDDLLDRFGKSTNDMVASLRVLAQTADQIADGDLTVHIESRSQNDTLSQAFMKMIDHLKSLLQNLSGMSGTTEHAADEVAQTTQQVKQMMAQVQSSIQQIASATNQVAKSAQGIAALVQNANKVVDVGNRSVTAVADKFTGMQNTMEATSHSITELHERSQEISEILGLITKIADQTNLLALNAAIEAARAGEAGRGFAVVADEVRKLAESSSTSAGKITQIIKVIQQNTGSVVSSSQNSLLEARQVLELVEKMRTGYAEIVDAIRGMQHEVEQIAAVSEETAASAEEISAGTEEQTAAINEIASSAQSLAEKATTLKTEIDKFKL